MTQTSSLEILKQAIILEKRGYAFYHKVAKHAEDEAVKLFFESMAQEELGHINILNDQFKAYNEKGAFRSDSFDESEEINLALSILNSEIKEKISEASFEAAAISAAISMEQRAVEIYSRQSEKATDPEEKKLYLWLANWEQLHLKVLMEIDRALLDQVWGDNNFWPF